MLQDLSSAEGRACFHGQINVTISSDCCERSCMHVCDRCASKSISSCCTKATYFNDNISMAWPRECVRQIGLTVGGCIGNIRVL